MGVRGVKLAAAVALLGGVAAADAGAATRYAEPSGNGPAATCPQSNPCDVQVAVEHNSVADGDKVVLLPGNYALADPLAWYTAIVITGLGPNARPTLTSSSAYAVAVGSGSVLRNVELIGNNVNAMLLISGGAVAERVIVHATGTSGYAVFMGSDGGTAVLRDSLVTSQVPAANGWFGVLAGGGLDSPAKSVLLNTHVQTYNTAVMAYAAYGQGDLRVRNSYARSADATDLYADATNEPGGSIIRVDHSYFATQDSIAMGQVIEGAGNIGGVPLFVDPANGNFTQLPQSPTINAGTRHAELGARDFYGDPRIGDGVPDIGLDETDVRDPKTTLTRKPRRSSTAERVRFRFKSDERPSTFRCTLDGGATRACSSPFRRTLAPGRHRFAVFAIDAFGKPDPTPAKHRFRIRRR